MYDVLEPTLHRLKRDVPTYVLFEGIIKMPIPSIWLDLLERAGGVKIKYAAL